MRAHRERLRQKQEIESLKNENRKLRSRALKEKIAAQYRSPNDKTNTEECPLPDLTPNTKINVTLEKAGVVVPNSIKKKLVFGECLKQHLNANFKSIKGHRSKQVFSEVVGGGILKKYGVTCKLNMSQYLSTSLPSRKKKRADVKINSVKRDVIQFFENDDNSRLRAGKKECITYKKVKKQKRYLNYSLKSLHQKYLKEKGCKISYTTFCRLRPFWVVVPRLGSQDTCLCITHENFRLIVSRLHFEKIINLKTPEEVISAVTCTPHNEECLSRQCKTCKEIQVPVNEFNANSQCQYQKWCTKKESRVSSKTGKTIIVQITLKEDITISHYNLVQEVFLLLPKYMLHVRNIYHQHRTLSTIKKSLNESKLLLHIDFSENYSCKYSSEAQSVHFGASRQQITLHTGVAYSKDRVSSFCTISPSLRHDAKAIAAHLIPILERFSTPLINTIYFLSDSPSTQYRNRTMFNIIGYYLPTKFRNINKISWSYSEAGHGKGAPDGIGATLKRTAYRLVAENTDIPCYEKFVNVVKKNVSNIQ
ncbi:uncharacterized protein LOC126888787 [Diabrotica virgifera virgifera]|uniref:Uncharacterized protein n=1 Tax=Diabrotica virgifera virgifera TaxID=50390 RepID=A0ABM5KSF5_DIAVI|nr:uncharacterized protein LOC126888787 [Diabrotica virgifera virgifera]